MQKRWIYSLIPHRMVYVSCIQIWQSVPPTNIIQNFEKQGAQDTPKNQNERKIE